MRAYSDNQGRRREWVSSAALHKLSADKEGMVVVVMAVVVVTALGWGHLVSLPSSAPRLAPCPLGLAACNLRARAQRPNAKPIMGEAGCARI